MKVNHEELLRYAEELIEGSKYYFDGEWCLVLGQYLDKLEAYLETKFTTEETETSMRLNANATACYLWCCLAAKAGVDSFGDSYCGMVVIK